MRFISKLKRSLYLVIVRYFRFFANISLRRWKPRVIAVTGSVGKTTLLNILEVQLGDQAHYSHNANSAYGISFDVLGLDGVRGSRLKWLGLAVSAPFRAFYFRHKNEFYVVEIDGERPDETKFLAEWLRPEVTFWVSVGRSHAVYFDNQVERGEFQSVDDAILHEFLQLPKQTSQLVIYDGDNPDISGAMESLKGVRSASVSRDLVSEYSVTAKSTKFNISNVSFEFNNPMPIEVGTQLAMLLQFTEYLGVEPVTDLSSYQMPPGRSSYFKGKNSVDIIDSSYNAHLISMRSMIDLLKACQTNGEKWIVVGDIIEAGKSEQQEHVTLGDILNAAGFDRYILVGRRTSAYTYPQLDPKRSVAFINPRDAAEYLRSELAGGETVLFKGSQYLEGIIEELLDNSSDAANLPRREPVATRRRQAMWEIR